MNTSPLPRILVVDDEQEITEYLCSILKEIGFDASAANSGEQALLLFEQSHFDLVITDLMMPGMNGFDLMTNLRSLQPSLPIIVLTAYDNREMMREAMKHGAYDFLAKPISPEEMKITLRNALDSRQAVLEKIRAESDLERLRSFIGVSEPRKASTDPFLPKLFRGWRREDYIALKGLGRDTALESGAEIAWDSASSGGLIIVQTGRLSVERGKNNVILLFGGDSWGAPSVLNFAMRPVRLVAETETRILRIPLDELLLFFRQHEERYFKLFVLNVVYTISEWLEMTFDRVIKYDILTGANSLTK